MKREMAAKKTTSRKSDASLDFSSINEFYRTPEETLIPSLLNQYPLDSAAQKRIQKNTKTFIDLVRKGKKDLGVVDQMMDQFDIGSKEGQNLMALAESYIRIPDAKTADMLANEKIMKTNLGQMSASKPQGMSKVMDKTFKFAQKLLGAGNKDSGLSKALGQMTQPFMRFGVGQSMRLLADRFVIGEDIQKALQKSQENQKIGFSHSFDMLGEAALTAEDARRYFESYLNAIKAVGAHNKKHPEHKGSVSIKLSALHPRYEYAQKERVLSELVPVLRQLCQEAAELGVEITIDAEEADRLELSLEVFHQVFADPIFKDWSGFGMAVQAYQKRCSKVLEVLTKLSQDYGKAIKVRLVKGAYWDSEIKWAQERGLKDYPVFTRKRSTDLNYLVCARYLLDHTQYLKPQFATHNLHTIAAITDMAQGNVDYEFQCLWGMGEGIYQSLMKGSLKAPVRIYAPVGNYQDLLPYLVRRLLENGANSSFLNALNQPTGNDQALVQDPSQALDGITAFSHPKISLPKDMFSDRQNSGSLDLSNGVELAPLEETLKAFTEIHVRSDLQGVQERQSISPIDGRVLGTVQDLGVEGLTQAFDQASQAYKTWAQKDVAERAACLNAAADLLEKNLPEFMMLCVYEGGKTIPDALAEVREAIDFCRYYAAQATQVLSPHHLPGPTGESNILHLKGRGVFVCISPWNFPLAIFAGQVVAALVSGNAVLAKPASQTCVIASKFVDLLYEAGIPKDALHLIPSSGSQVQDTLLTRKDIGGVCFTGSTETAWVINQTLALRKGPIIPFIAETGGQNAMVVDSSALPEQVVQDVVMSAFRSAGQRCSALRLLVLQEEIAPRVLDLLKGAMDQLSLGDPKNLATDIGPVIDQSALTHLQDYEKALAKTGTLIKKCETKTTPKNGFYFGPCAYELKSFKDLTEEHFGPILHVVRYKAEDLSQVIEGINDLGFGLTFGLHSRLDSRIEGIHKLISAGNVYINRNMIGAVVGVQPFGGQGLSGTGPKAGGPHYLPRFCHEQTVTTNTTAQGGNASLMVLSEDD